MRDVSNKNDSKQKDGRLFSRDWFAENLYMIILIILLLVTAAIFFWLGMRTQYCLDFPNCPECQEHNVTVSIIKSLTCR